MSDLRSFVDDVLLPALSAEAAYNWPGHNFTAAGDRLRGSCPFHESKSGSSFVVTRSSGLWWCQGCAQGGDVLSYRHRLAGGNGSGPRGAAFVELVRALAREAGVPFPERDLSPEEQRRAEEASRNRAALEEVYAKAAARLWTQEGEAARTYLRGRGLTDEAIRDFGLGLAGDEVRLEDRGYILLPWRDELGRPLTYYGRWPGVPPAGKPKTTAMPGEGTKRSPIGLDRVRGDEVVVVEGFFDDLVLRQAGDERVVSGIAGTLPQAAIDRLARRGIRRAYICGDPDTGGRNGNESNVRRLHAAGLETFVVEELPDGLDPDEFVLAHGIAAWRERVKAALPGWVWIGVQRIGEIAPESHETAKRTVIRETREAIADAPRVDREDVLRRLAGATGYSVEALEGRPGAIVVGSAGPRPLTETGNAERLVARFGDHLRWSSSLGWLVWDGRRWARDDRRRAFALAKETVREIYREAGEVDDPDVRKAIGKWATKSETRNAREAMVALAASEEGIAVTVDELDRDPWALNVVNGTLDLRTGKLRPHDRRDLFTKLAPVTFAPDASAETWRAFLERVLPDEEVRGFVQRFAGYALSGVVREHLLPMLYGTGANGKSTFLEALRFVLGDYAAQANPALLMAKPNETHPTDRATLLGRRLAVVAETEEGRALAEVMVKQLTGGDSINARFMRQDEFTFRPTHKLVMGTNHKPRVRGTDVGIWRRIALVPFTVTIPEDERDAALPERLRTEAPGILRWAVEGCMEWQRDGLRPPAAVRAATDEYRRDEDLLEQFLADRCYVSDGRSETVRLPAGDLFAAYRGWCEETGVREVSQRTFGAAMSERGFERRRGGHRLFYIGLRLLHPAERSEASGASE